MYAKLIDNNLKYAPNYLIINNKLVLNPQSTNYLDAGYKQVEIMPIPTVQLGQHVVKTISENEDTIFVNYSLVDDEIITNEQEN